MCKMYKRNMAKLMWHLQPSLQSIHLLMSVWARWINKVLILREASLLTASWRQGGAEPQCRRGRGRLCGNSWCPSTPLGCFILTGTPTLWEAPARRGHSWLLAFCSNLSFSSDIAAIGTRAHGAVSFDIMAGELNDTWIEAENIYV